MRMAGVDIDKADRLVERIKKNCKSDFQVGCYFRESGGFGGMFFTQHRRHGKVPVLVSSTDGVGTKLKIAVMNGKNTIPSAIDLVAMCVNDIIVQGTKTAVLSRLSFHGKSWEDQHRYGCHHRKSVKDCRQAGCALIGGETAEDAGISIRDNEYDPCRFLSWGLSKTVKIIDGSENPRGGSTDRNCIQRASQQWIFPGTQDLL